jgi:hypothetical protein
MEIGQQYMMATYHLLARHTHEWGKGTDCLFLKPGRETVRKSAK